MCVRNRIKTAFHISIYVFFAANKRRFEFNLSFQQGYGNYKISHIKSPSIEKPSFNSLYSCDFSESRVAVLDSGQISKFSTTAAEDSSLHNKLLLEERVDSQPQNSTERDGSCSVSPHVSTCDHEDLHLDNSSVFDGPERRLSHEECRKIELTDWEWCRSKSERTPRQVRSHPFIRHKGFKGSYFILLYVNEKTTVTGYFIILCKSLQTPIKKQVSSLLKISDNWRFL